MEYRDSFVALLIFKIYTGEKFFSIFVVAKNFFLIIDEVGSVA